MFFSYTVCCTEYDSLCYQQLGLLLLLLLFCGAFRCYIDYANHQQMIQSSDGLVNLINYTLFLAELMLAHKVCMISMLRCDDVVLCLSKNCFCFFILNEFLQRFIQVVKIARL